MTPEIFRAVSQTVRACGLRLRPDAQVGEIVSYMESKGVTLGTVGTQLTATMNGQPVDVATVLTALPSKPEVKQHFVTPTDQVTHLSDLSDTASKTAYISKYGYPAFEKMVA